MHRYIGTERHTEGAYRKAYWSIQKHMQKGMLHSSFSFLVLIYVSIGDSKTVSTRWRNYRYCLIAKQHRAHYCLSANVVCCASCQLAAWTRQVTAVYVLWYSTRRAKIQSNITISDTYPTQSNPIQSIYSNMRVADRCFESSEWGFKNYYRHAFDNMEGDLRNQHSVIDHFLQNIFDSNANGLYIHRF